MKTKDKIKIIDDAIKVTQSVKKIMSSLGISESVLNKEPSNRDTCKMMQLLYPDYKGDK